MFIFIWGENNSQIHIIIVILNPYNAKYICINYEEQNFFQFEIIINILVASFRIKYSCDKRLWGAKYIRRKPAPTPRENRLFNGIATVADSGQSCKTHQHERERAKHTNASVSAILHGTSDATKDAKIAWLSTNQRSVQSDKQRDIWGAKTGATRDKSLSFENYRVGYRAHVRRRIGMFGQWSILLCKAKRQYLLTCKVSRYCLLTLHDRIVHIVR